MKQQLQWITLVVIFIALIAGSLGCATLLAKSAVQNDDFYSKPVLSDHIIAIGKPDEAMSKAIGKDHLVAFLGKNNTYMLYKGGEELEQISKLNLVATHLQIDAASSRKLYLKDKQVWGKILLTYHTNGLVATSTEQAELEKSGFVTFGNKRYQKKIQVAGTVTPAIKLTNEQLSKLTTIRAVNFYNPRDAKPPDNIGAYLLVPAGVVVDIALSPVYLAGFLVLLIGTTH